MKIIYTLILSLSFLFGFSGLGNAILWDRGGGMIYDDVLEITWMQNANYMQEELSDERVTQIMASSPIFDGWGTPIDHYQYIQNEWRVSWYGAMAWAEQLTWGGHDDWRLLSVDVNGDDNVVSQAVSEENARDNEFVYMYYHNMGASYLDNMTGNQTVGSVDFYNVGGGWTSTQHPNPSHVDRWVCSFGNGNDHLIPFYSMLNTTWAVRDGDVSPVPEPSTILLLGTGIVGLAGFGRKKFFNR